ncbi:MAG: oligosaccharide flippase family protein [Candidatus Neomarinimicrobiota bacterium]
MAIRKPIVELGRSTAIYGLGNVPSKLAAFLLIPIYTRYLPLEQVGILVLLEMVETFLVVLIPFGINNAVWRYLAGGKGTERKRVVASAYGGSLVLNVVVLGLIAVLHRFPGKFVGLGPSQDFLILILLLNVFLAFGTRFFLGLLQYDGKALTYVLFSSTQFIGVLAVTFIFVVMKGWGLLGVLVARSVVYGIAFLVTGSEILRSNNARPSLTIFLRLLKFAGPLVILAMVAPVLTVSDRFFLKLFVSLEEIAVYGIAYKFGMLISMFFVIPLQRGWGPMMYRMGVEEESHEYHRDVLFYFAVMGGLFFLAISFFAGEVISLAATRDYVAGAAIIPLVTLAYFLSGFRQFFMAGAAVGGQTPRLAWAAAISIILNLLLNFLLVKNYGVMGAAWATLSSYAILAAGVYLASQKVARIDWNWYRLGKLMVTMLAVFWAIHTLQFQHPDWRLQWGLLGLFLFPALLWLTRTIGVRELRGLTYLLKSTWKRLRHALDR